MACRHFESHVKATPRPPPPYSDESNKMKSSFSRPSLLGISNLIATPSLSLPQKPLKTFSSVGWADPPPPQIKQNNDHRSQKHNQIPKAIFKPQAIENRLLVRVSSGQPALKMSPYAVMQHLNIFLNPKVVREVQKIKTGFAICPASFSAQEALHSRMVEIEKFLSTLGECKVEIPQDYQAYRLSGVPRSYKGFNGSII